jgi:hypothetical protein
VHIIGPKVQQASRYIGKRMKKYILKALHVAHNPLKKKIQKIPSILGLI